MFGIISLIILFIVYIWLDPFKVLRSEDVIKSTMQNGGIGPNRDFVSTAVYKKNKSIYNYNSFIFGNSCSIFYQVSDWKKYLPANSSCYHFDASGESLYGILRKMEYVSNGGAKLENVLLILDYKTLVQDKPGTGQLYIISPELVGNSNLADFHWTYFKSFLSPMFFYAYIDFRISGKVKLYMKKFHLLDDTPFYYDSVTNEIRFDNFEDSIRLNRFYTADRLKMFSHRDTSNLDAYPAAIGESQKEILLGMKKIFKEQGTRYRIIISPLYDQLKISHDDLNCLDSIFGKRNVFDYSGVNEYTKDFYNYYDVVHCRPSVTREILNSIYVER